LPPLSFSAVLLSFGIVTIVRRADGLERMVEASASFLTEAGKRTMMLSTMRDITDRKHQEQEVQRLTEILAKHQDGNS
jgi:hypothetical protein